MKEDEDESITGADREAESEAREGGREEEGASPRAPIVDRTTDESVGEKEEDDDDEEGDGLTVR